MTVWRAIKRFKAVGSYSDRSRIGRQRTARLKKTAKAVAEKARRRPNRKMSNFTQNWLKDNVENFWEKTMWQPCSPDLNPLDFLI